MRSARFGAMLTDSQRATFRSGGYSRIVAYAATDDESEERSVSSGTCGRWRINTSHGRRHVLSHSAVNYDLMDTITGDNLKVLAAAIIAIGIVLLLAFRNAFTPLILILTIEGAIWINMSIPHLTGGSLNYIGYQIISSVQLGATIDYGICSRRVAFEM